MKSVPRADTYGGILLSRCGHVLLHEPTPHADGPHWTFANGKPGKDEEPHRAAQRLVYEATGYLAAIVDVLPKVYQNNPASTAMFIMHHLNEQHPYSWTTQSTHWATFDEARQLISHTPHDAGREQDLQILDDVEIWYHYSGHATLPALDEYRWQPARPGDWNTLLMPHHITTIPLNLTFNAQQAALLRMGLVPAQMEDKWFCYFADNVLHMHRSWTGQCIYQIHFEPHKDGLIATHADINRDPLQYDETRDEADSRIIGTELAALASPIRRLYPFDHTAGSRHHPETGPRHLYLGSPRTIHALFHSFFSALAAAWHDKLTDQEVELQMHQLALILSGQNPDYTIMPGWYSVAQLGKTLIACCGLDAERCRGKDLYFHVSEALAAIRQQFDSFREELLNANQYTQSHEQLLDTLHQLQNFVCQVFLGVHGLEFEGRALTDFAQPA